MRPQVQGFRTYGALTPTACCGYKEGVSYTPPYRSPPVSKGSPVFRVRIPQALYDEMQLQIESRNAHVPNAPWDDSKFIVCAIIEKLDKMARSRGEQRRAHHRVDYTVS